MLLVVIGITIAFFILLYKRNDNYKFSKTMLILFGVSVLANVSLSHNHIYSLIPGIHDGIGISNTIAYSIITDNVQWSADLFKRVYNYSTIVSGILLILLLLSFIKESYRTNAG